MKKYSLKSFKNITIIQTAFLGDVALTLPLVQTVRDNNPDSHIYFITTPKAAPIVKLSTAVNSIISYDKRNTNKGLAGIKKISGHLKSLENHLILAPHRSLRTTILSYLSKADLSVSFSRSSLSFLYNKRVKYQSHLHEIKRNLSLLNIFDDINSKKGIDEVELKYDFNDVNYVDNLIAGFGIKDGDRLIAIAPGSVWETKKWPAKYYKELTGKLSSEGYKCVIIGSSEDAELCKFVAGDSGVSLAGKTDIAQSIYLLTLCKLTITNDSAPTHFAGLAGCDVITIFGATSPIFGFYPTGRNAKIIENKELKCRPCKIHGSNKCPIGTLECMHSIKADDVKTVALSLLK